MHVSRTRLVFNDSLSYQYYLPKHKEFRKDDFVFGSEIDHHGVLIDRNGGFLYSYVGSPNYSRSFVIRDTIPDKTWLLTGRKRRILKYECLEAEQDSITVWFSPTLGKHSPMAHYSGFAGVPLEIIDTRHGFKFKAFKIEFGDYQIDLARVPVMTMAEFRKMREIQSKQLNN